MIYIFYTTYISVDFAHQVIFHAKVGKGGINMCKGGNLFLQLIILSIESICIKFVTEWIIWN